MKENKNPYIITGGEEGKKRLHILSDVLKDSTKSLLIRNDVLSVKRFLDLGCGGGDVSMMVAQMLGENSHVTAIDFDKEIISLAQKDAIQSGIKNMEFKALNVYDIDFENEFDMVYSRFLLSHLKDPLSVLFKMIRSLKPGGRIIVEDVEFSGHFSFPENEAFKSYIQLYKQSAELKDQNPEIGPSLFSLFQLAKVSNINFDVIQPCFNKGPGKWMAYITMDKIKESVINHGLADFEAIDTLLKDLKEFTEDENTIISLPRIFRVSGIKSAELRN